MHLTPFDMGVVAAYIILIFFIAFKANIFMRGQRGEDRNTIENHYLAGKTITFWEALMSIIATEFSALAFLTIPTYAYFENLNYVRFIIGACISRALIAFYFLPSVYGKGLTIFEALGRGINGYKSLSKQNMRAKKIFSFFYIITKIIGLSIKFLGGATLIADFFEIPLFSAITLIALFTYIYIMIGGLKGVVRTDMVQAAVFIFGGLMAHYIVSKISPLSWGELFAFGVNKGKFSLFSSGGGLTFIYGILAGVAYDAATHGVDQDLVQKLFGTKDIKTAQRALAWSSLGSLFVNMLFLTLGVILWSFYTTQGNGVPEGARLFSSLIENHFPSPVKGLMVASILAACMSTLDSSINALSACFWNDLMVTDKSKMFRLYISMDNFIITVSIIIVTYAFSLLPMFISYGTYFAYLSTAPLLAFFLCRMLLSKYIKVAFSAMIVILTIISCFLGMGLNHFRFGFNPQLTILWGLLTSIIFIWFYSRISDLLRPTSKESKL